VNLALEAATRQSEFDTISACIAPQRPHLTQIMVRDPSTTEDEPVLQDVLDALDDPACRTILTHLDEPMTAKELADACAIPLSTMYRKLDLLNDASLVNERTEIRQDGQHTSRYALAVEEIRITLDETQRVDVQIKRAPSDPGERLSELWSEVRKET
jgi:DNA-binding transcriptional ArsR family regulator